MAQQIIDAFWDRKNLLKINGNFTELYGNSNVLDSAMKDLVNRQVSLEGESRRLLTQAESINKRAEEVNAENKSVQQQINNIVLDSGNTNSEVVQARGGFTLLNDRLTSIANASGIDPSIYGLSVKSTWDKNRDALQKANDELAKNGGGVINIRPGTYQLKGLVLDSNVELNLKDVVLKHPDGLAPSLLASKVINKTASVTKGSKKIVLDGDTTAYKDCVFIVEGIGGISNTQRTELASNIDNATTSIQLAADDGKFPKNSVLRIGDELIKYSTISNKIVTVTERGAFGTVATSHSSNETIGLANVFYTEVTSTNSNELQIRDDIPLSATNVKCWVGSKNINLYGGTIDGNKMSGGSPSSVFGFDLAHVRFCNITNTHFENCDQGAIFLNKGAKENNITNCSFKDNSVYNLQTGNKGASIWMFEGCKFNKVVNPTFSGSGWVAMYIDDRTTIADVFDASNTDNYIVNPTIDFINSPPGYNVGIVITGSSRNVVSNGYIKGPYTGVKIEQGSQYLKEPEKAENNEISSFYFDTNQPWNVSSSGNRLNNIVYSDRMIAQPVTEESTLMYGYSSSKGKNATFGNITFDDGMPSAPSITFRNDKDTGFIRYGENTIGVISGGEFLITFYNVLARFKDGYNLELGTNTGTKFGTNPNQKIGFYGKTPIAQQTTLSNTSGYTLQQLEYEVNAVKNVLRNIGIVSG